MATLVLTTVGTALGGPVGGALGSLIGGAIDTQIFGAGPRKGPRLDDLKVQTSSYGTPIPQIYGRMRVAGTVVWATDLKETEEIEGGGKGSPEVVRYNYSCSFAVALSSRKVRRIGRIWADGKLIRGAAGDFKVQTGYRFLDGSEGQRADPLIAAIEGAAGTPAYRGLALAVFEDMALAEFGNRLPMLTFEVIGDEAPVAVAEVIAESSGGIVEPSVAGATPEVVGYAAFGSDRRAAIEQLADLASVRFREGEGRLAVANGRDVVVLAGDEAMGWDADGKAAAAHGEWRQDAAAALPATLAIRYHEPARDFQSGEMRATMPGGRGAMTFDSAAALAAGDAKGWAERALARRWAGRERISLRLSPEHAALSPGDQLEVGWRAGLWTVEEVTVDAFAVIVECRRAGGGGRASFDADPGRSIVQPDLPIGPSHVALFDLPDLGEGGDRLRLHAAVSGAGAFKAVPLASVVAGQNGPTILAARRARLGTCVSLPGPASPWAFDTINAFDVELFDLDQALLNADDDALDAGANLAMVGDELLQFGRAMPLGGGRWRLAKLLRGRRGTEWAIGGHGAGEHFVMVDRAALVPLELDPALLGSAVEIYAQGIADDPADPPQAARTATGAALAPLSPCFVTAEPFGGGLRVRWVRRMRSAWAWGGEQVGEAGGRFSVRMSGSGGTVERIVDGIELVVSPAEASAIGLGPATIEVRELGPWRQSAAATATIEH